MQQKQLKRKRTRGTRNHNSRLTIFTNTHRAQ